MGAKQSSPSEPQEATDRSLKARNPDLYYGTLHMDCYHFYQQCEDHFKTAGAKGHRRVPCAASFLRGKINFRWQQYKLQVERKRATPVTWEEFKSFPRKSLRDSTSFVDNIWSKIERDSQYQQEEVQDWASHLEHLQSILMEFDAKCVPSEDLLAQYFYKAFRPSIKLWIDEEGRELDGWKDLIKKVTRAEAKAGMQPPANREMDQRCQRGNRPAYVTAAKVQTQELSMEDARIEEPKPSNNYSQIDTSKKTPEKTQKEKKQQRCHKHKQARKESGSTSDINAPRASQARKDLSHITCFNCDQQGQYATKCPKPKRERDDSLSENSTG